jgi:hypothetical protein
VRVVFNPYWLVRTLGVCTLDDATIIGESAFLPDNERTIKLVCKKKKFAKDVALDKKRKYFPFPLSKNGYGRLCNYDLSFFSLYLVSFLFLSIYIISITSRAWPLPSK